MIASGVFLQKRPHLKIVLGAAIGFWLVCAALALWRYYQFYPSYATFDQGIFNQVFWNSLHGNFFQSSLSSTESIAVAQDGAVPTVAYHRLGQHFTPSLMLWLPIYALFPSPAGLSLLQVTLVAIAGLVLYALARQRLAPPPSVWITLSYFVANAVIGPTLANFHDFSQIPLFIFGLLLALEKRWWRVVALLAVLTLLVREDAGVVLFGVGFYLALQRQWRGLGFALCLLSVAYMAVLTLVVMPLFSEDLSRRFMVEQFGQFVGEEDASTVEVVWGMLTQPFILIRELLSPIGLTLRYLLGQGLPLAFVPWVSPTSWSIAGFPLLQVLLRQDPSSLALDRRYAITLVPGLFYGAILWWAQHSHRFTQRFRRIWLLCMALALGLTLTANPNRAMSWVVPDSIQPWVYTSPARQVAHAQAIRSLLAEIPPDASVSASSFIVPHVSGRREALRFPQLRLQTDRSQVIAVDYAVVDLWQFQQYQSVFPWEQEQLQRSLKGVDRMVQSDRYGVTQFQDGVVLLQRGVESDEKALNDWTGYRSSLNSASL
ncbi:MAG: DUF2079 domain-containing protein [Leptolyngbyaceae cyanobacterium SL_7_1]|nr:DUF2079 domain-containing protein [Leptolyngbyaceae cyanobacterium SL_7_1]